MFRIDNFSRTPIYEQLIEQFERFILTGALTPGAQIPSVRSLSVQLSINPNTVQKAYSELDSRALIYSLPGKGSFVDRTVPFHHHRFSPRFFEEQLTNRSCICLKCTIQWFDIHIYCEKIITNKFIHPSHHTFRVCVCVHACTRGCTLAENT